MVPISLFPPSSPHFLAGTAVKAGQLLGWRAAEESAVGGAECWIPAMAVEAGEQGYDSHSKECRKMSGITCDVAVSQGEPWGCTEAGWRWWEGSALCLEEGNGNSACGPRVLELDG